MKKALLIISSIFVFLIVVLLVGFFWYQNSLKPVGSSKEPIEVEISSGSTYSTLANLLYDQKLIRSKTAYKIYIKLNPPKEDLKAGTYSLSQDMSVEEILEVLSKGGKSTNPLEISILFKEGLNMRQMAKVIEENTNHTQKEVLDTISDETFLKELIQEYWFLDDSILEEDIYYPLEGYLYPDTYSFSSKDVSVEEIIKTLLNEMGKKLEPYRKEIEKSDYTVHEILTLASVVELEAASSEYRSEVAGVFFNRLNSNWQLGSDVTTYYGAKIEMSERDLMVAEIEAINGYNTRPAAMAGKLPVGPICNPSISAIEAVLAPKKTTAYYFIADNQGKVYFTKTYQEHIEMREYLKEHGLWERYQ